MSIYHNLEKLILIALSASIKHECNYNIILINPSENGEYTEGVSSYGFVTDSFFDTERPDVLLLSKTDDLHAKHLDKNEEENTLGYSDEWQVYRGYEKFEYDIQMKSGELIENCYPNDGIFCSLRTNDRYREEYIDYIRFANNPLTIMNLDVSEMKPQIDTTPSFERRRNFLRFSNMMALASSISSAAHVYIDEPYLPGHNRDNRNFRPKEPRTLPKVGRNEPCNCGCGARKSKFCTQKT
jgi:hypothetical protein